jgi:hypothetical protein
VTDLGCLVRITNGAMGTSEKTLLNGKRSAPGWLRKQAISVLLLNILHACEASKKSTCGKNATKKVTNHIKNITRKRKRFFEKNARH